ncbi:hypothetical protein TWF281_007126 [Arthrobotrys megalospora]
MPLSGGSRRHSGGSSSEDDGFELVDFDTKSHESIAFTNTENTTADRITELKQALKDGNITPNQKKNVERVILDLEKGVEWYLYEDGRHVTHMTRNFSRVLWKELGPHDI